MPQPPELGAVITPIAVRQVDVQYHRIDATILGIDGCLSRIECLREGEGKPMLTREVIHQSLSNVGVIIHDQDGSHFWYHLTLSPRP